jgi:hypothetical protein
MARRGPSRVDHVIAATGYKPALARLPFLDPGLHRQIDAIDDVPELGDTFEASTPGLYFHRRARGPQLRPVRAVRLRRGLHRTLPRPPSGPALTRRLVQD